MLNMQRPPVKPVLTWRAIGFTNEVLGEIEGYIAVWGSETHRDSYGTFFDRAAPPDMALDFLPFPLMVEHGQDGKIRKGIVGAVRRIFFDNIGIKFAGTLNAASPFFQETVDKIRRKKYKTSSSTAGHIADFDAVGRFVKWYLSELSLTENPAESKMPVVTLIRSGSCPDGQCYINPYVYPEESPLAAAGVNATGNISNSRSNATMSALQQLLAGDPSAVTPEALISAAQQDGIDPQALLASLQQMMQPAQEGMSTALAGEQTPGATPAAPVMQQPAPQQFQPAPNVQPGQTITDPALLEQLAALLGGRANPPAGGRSLTIPYGQQQQRNQMTAPPQQGRYAPQQAGYQIVNPAPQNVRTRQAEITVSSRYQHLAPEDMATGYSILEGKRRSGRGGGASELYLRAMAYKTAVEVERGNKIAIDYAVRSKFPFQKPGDVMQSDLTNMTYNPHYRTGEIMDGTTGQGDEWIYDLQGTSLWESIRNDTPVYAAMKAKGMDESEIPQGFNGELIPLEGSDPSWYVASGATDLDSSGNPVATFSSSKFGTGQKAVTVAKLSVAMQFEKELEEDSVINIVQEAQRKIRVTASEQIDYILLNGDTALGANTNINKIDGTPTAAPARPSYTLLDGMVKLALSSSLTRRDAGAAFDETDFLATLKMLPAAVRQDRSKLLYIFDSDTGIQAANITTLKTRDVFTAATLENGTLLKIWKIDALETGFMYLANSVGKISVTGSNNIYGRLLLTVPRLWASRWKRRLQTEVTYFPYADVTQIVAHMRWGLAYRDANAAAITYDIPQTI